MKRKVPRPRLPFCWVCSRKLQANFHRVVFVDGILRIVHAACAKAGHLSGDFVAGPAAQCAPKPHGLAAVGPYIKCVFDMRHGLYLPYVVTR